MKKSISLFMAACLMWIMTFQTSCIGSFNLTKGLHDWNTSHSKFVDEILFLVFIILPIYNLTLLIDAVILNLIEFWTGSNPMGMVEGEMEQQVVMGKDGNSYEITATKNRFDIKQLSGDKTGDVQSLIYEPSTRAWSHEKFCETTKLMQYSPDGQYVSVFGDEGKVARIPADIRDQAIASAMIQKQFAVQSVAN